MASSYVTTYPSNLQTSLRVSHVKRITLLFITAFTCTCVYFLHQISWVKDDLDANDTTGTKNDIYSDGNALQEINVHPKYEDTNIILSDFDIITKENATFEEDLSYQAGQDYHKYFMEDDAGGVYLSRSVLRRFRPPDNSYNINVTATDVSPLNVKYKVESNKEQCSRINFTLKTITSVSIIVPFYNEALSTLLRTVFSVLITSGDFLHEIILVDDCSSNSDNKDLLKKMLRALGESKIRLLRNKQRLGLIRSRQRGADEASGEVLVFLDAHTECSVGWLEPLLHEINSDIEVIIQPTVGAVDSHTFDVHDDLINSSPRSLFSWDLRLMWAFSPSPNSSLPYRTASLVGCAIAVHRLYFTQLRGFDETMSFWGGENAEISFRAWSCGGRVLTHPCSVVFHLFRPLPYLTEHNHHEIPRNLARTAEIYMEEYLPLFYATLKKPLQLTAEDKYIVSQRKQRRIQDNCTHSFKSLLKNVLPEMPIPKQDDEFFGHVFISGRCLSMTEKGDLVFTKQCNSNRLIPQHFFSINEKGEFKHVITSRCVTRDLIGRPCQEVKDRWMVTSNHKSIDHFYFIIEKLRESPNRCLALVSSSKLTLIRCKTRRVKKLWTFTYHFDYSHMRL